MAMMFRLCEKGTTIVGSNVARSFRGHAPGKRTVLLTHSGILPPNIKRGTLVSPTIEHALSLCDADEEVFVAGGMRTFAAFLPLANAITFLMLDAESVAESPEAAPIKFPNWDSLYAPGLIERWRFQPDGRILKIHFVRSAKTAIAPPEKSTAHLTPASFAAGVRAHPQFLGGRSAPPAPAISKTADTEFAQLLDDKHLEFAIASIETAELQQAIYLNNIEKQPTWSSDESDDYDSFLESDYDDEDFGDDDDESDE